MSVTTALPASASKATLPQVSSSANAEAGPSTTSSEPHLMRIASQGALKNYIAFALGFLQDNPACPLVLHTLPVSSSLGTSCAASSSSLSGARSKKPTPPTTASIPRLISTVEIIKRAYLGEVAKSRTAKGKGRSGLWQYNETGCLEDLPKEGEGAVDAVHRRGGWRNDISEAEAALDQMKDLLGGKAGPKLVHTPYMKITLSTQPLEYLAQDRLITSQKIVLPVGPKTSKSKERRARAATLRAARQTEQPVAAAALPAPLLSVDSAAASAPPASESSMETIGGDGRVPEWKKGKGKKRPSEVAKGGGGDQGEVGTGKQGEGAVGPDQQSRKKKRKV